MCVAAFAWQAHPRWHLVAVGNRDELHDRPTAPLARWATPGGILAGRDLKSGGTWLGVSDAGRFALVTNVRGPGYPDPDRASRGALVTDQLTGVGTYAHLEGARLNDFNPFNLIVADSHDARFTSNQPQAIRTALASGIYGLSNGTLDEPWPKTLQLKASLLDWLTTDGEDFAPLFEALASETLPDIAVHPGQPFDISHEASETPVFIRNSLYGTRCSTVIAIDRQGKGTIIERCFAADGQASGETALPFDWQAE
jgi:uncharacterized protein with NRDE domain